MKVYENIENLAEDIKTSYLNDKEYNSSEEKGNHYLLRLGKENEIKFKISIENVSNLPLDKILFRKVLPENFYDLEFKSDTSGNFKVARNSIEYSLSRLSSGEKIEIVIIAKIFPKKKESIKTGKFELTFNLLEKVISGVEINHFSAYSHAMHAIKKTEKVHAPNHWDCSLIFENHSDFKMMLKSILLYDKTKSTKILEMDSNETVILPRGKYASTNFDFVDEKEPTFSRKVEYSVGYKTESSSMIISKYDENTFDVAGVIIKKNIADVEINSFEQSELDSKITISNEGTRPIKGLLISERIPEDFLPPRDITEYKLYGSSGTLEIEDLEIDINPDDDDPSHEHTIELKFNLKNDHLNSAIGVEDFLEVKYPLKAVTPDNKKEYNFPLKVCTYYPISANNEDKNSYYVITDDLSEMEKSAIKISHKRRKLTVGKEIFPGRSSNEFAIYIIARNGSNIKLSEVNVTDTFPDSFELVSANLEHKVSKSKNNGDHNISFTIDTILPFQEREIMYYLKNISSNDVKQSELESYFVG
ncbi:MAG: hypothetical protein ACW98D_14215 [Promethearchaeota archaeon]